MYFIDKLHILPIIICIMANYLSELSLALRKARKQTGDTQAMAAARVGVSRESYRKLEAGEPGVAVSSWIRVIELYGRPENLQFLFSKSLFDD